MGSGGRRQASSRREMEKVNRKEPRRRGAGAESAKIRGKEIKGQLDVGESYDLDMNVQHPTINNQRSSSWGRERGGV